MASNQLDSLSQVKAKSLECPICHERYNDPRILPCLHSFCSGCLINLANGTTKIKCPLCQEAISVPPKGAQDFSSNFQLRQIVEEAVMHDSLVKNATVMCDCHQGEEESEAVARCFECNQYLCVSGVDSHKRFRQLESHPVATVEDIRSGKVRPRAVGTSRKIWCKKHPKENATLFCESPTCDEPICNTCYNLYHTVKTKHNCRDIGEALPLLRKTVGIHATRLREVANNFEHEKERNDQIARNIREQADRKKALITIRVDEAKAKLEDDKRHLHEAVDAIAVRETAPFDRRATEFGNTAVQARNAHEQASGLKETGDGEFMQMYDVIKDKVAQLVQLHGPEDQREPRNIDWPEWIEEEKSCTIL